MDKELDKYESEIKLTVVASETRLHEFEIAVEEKLKELVEFYGVELESLIIG